MHEKDRKCISFFLLCVRVWTTEEKLLPTRLKNNNGLIFELIRGSCWFAKVSSAWLSWAFQFKGLQNRSGMEFDSNYTWIYPKKFASWCSSNKAGGRRSKFCSFFCLSWVFSPVHSLFSSEPRRGSVQSSGKEKTCADHARSTISLYMVETSDMTWLTWAVCGAWRWANAWER